MNPKYHLIRNFPKGTPWYLKLFHNLEFFIGTTTIDSRKNWLTQDEYSKSKHLLQPGDIVLTGTFRKFISLLLSGKVTHSLLYLGNGELIHVIADGVEKISYKKLFDFYDTLIVLRPKIRKNRKRKIIRSALSFAKKQLNKPYNFSFESTHLHSRYFCTQLINNAYHQAGFKTKLGDHHRAKKPLQPSDFLKSDQFDLVYHSDTVNVIY